MLLENIILFIIFELQKIIFAYSFQIEIIKLL